MLAVAISLAALNVQLVLSQLGLYHLVTFLDCTPVQLGLMLVAVFLAPLGVQLALSQLGPALFQVLGIYLLIFGHWNYYLDNLHTSRQPSV